MKKWIVVLALVATPPAQTLAQPTEDAVRRATNEASFEMVECAAYFMVISNGLRQTPGEKFQATADRYEKLSGEAMSYGLHMANLIDQKQETVVARLEMATKQMIEEMGNDYVNVSILMNKYGDTCTIAMEDPASRLEYWIEKHTDN